MILSERAKFTYSFQEKLGFARLHQIKFMPILRAYWQ